MKILIVHQYFNTPDSGGPLRSYYIARGLRQHGHQVEVITAHNNARAISKEIKGITVHYLPVPYDNSFGFIARIRAFVLFARMAWLKARFLEDIALCYAISTPLTVGWVALKLKKSRQIPYIFEVGDLWPEAPIQLKVIKNRWLIHRLRDFEKKVYRQAHRIVALSPGISEGILKSHAKAKVALIPNMADCNYFLPQHHQVTTVPGQRNEFVVLYFGAAGKANHLDFLVEAARSAVQTHSRLRFRIMARGSELERIKQEARDLSNVEFLDYRCRKDLKQILELCDAVYVSYAPAPVLTTGSPNKFFDGLAAGKLIIVNFRGWLKDLVELHELGIYADPSHPANLSRQLEPFMQNEVLKLRYQKNSRQLAEQYFSRELAVQKLLKVIDNQHQMTVNGSQVYTLTA